MRFASGTLKIKMLASTASGEGEPLNDTSILSGCHSCAIIYHSSYIYRAHCMRNESQLLDCIHDISGTVRAREARKPLNLRRMERESAG